MGLEITIRPCPICAAAASTTRRTVNGWELATCDGCGFLYAPATRANTATELEFPDDYRPVWRPRHRQIHRLLTRLLEPGDTIVDVGAGFGELGLIAGAAGQLAYIGFEPSESVAAVARRRGVEMRAEFFGPNSLESPVGAVVLDNVLEHLANPIELLEACAASLRPGGVLAVIVPNRYDVRQVSPRWRNANHWIPPEHVNYFTARSARRAMESFDLEVQPFSFAALGRDDWRYWPRAVAETLGLFPFGLNLLGRRGPTR